MKRFELPKRSLVFLIGPSGSGKSSFARKHFKPTEIVSSDACRGLVSDDESNQTATDDAFDVLHLVVVKRLTRRRLTVVDATSVKPQDRSALLDLARAHDTPPVAIVFDLPEEVCLERNRARRDREIPPEVVRRQAESMRQHRNGLKDEGFYRIFTLSSFEEAEAVSIERSEEGVG